MSPSISKLPDFPKLNQHNYATWVGNMKASLMSIHALKLVQGKETKPHDPKDPSLDKEWEEREELAAALIYLRLEDDQKIHVHNIEEDPVKMWNALATIHLQKKPAQHFNSYEALLSITKQPDETLS
jgi:hypothetical protein